VSEQLDVSAITKGWGEGTGSGARQIRENHECAELAFPCIFSGSAQLPWLKCIASEGGNTEEGDTHLDGPVLTWPFQSQWLCPLGTVPSLGGNARHRDCNECVGSYL
jgi:hypothetical protein